MSGGLVFNDTFQQLSSESTLAIVFSHFFSARFS